MTATSGRIRPATLVASSGDGALRIHKRDRMGAGESSPEILPATGAINWLLNEAVSVSAPGILLRELCSRLTAEALPISGALLNITSLDPLIAARRLRWQRGDERVLEEVLFHGMTAAQQP